MSLYFSARESGVKLQDNSRSEACSVDVMHGNVCLDCGYTQNPLSWKCSGQRDTVGKEQDKEVGKYVNPVLLIASVLCTKVVCSSLG